MLTYTFNFKYLCICVFVDLVKRGVLIRVGDISL